MATFPYAAAYPDGVAYPAIPGGTSVVNVSSSSALTTALANATAGQKIVLANATYSGAFTVSKTGTGNAGISIEAATTGGAVFASGSTITVNNAAYVTLKGLAFPYELSSGNTIQFRGTAHHCRVTRCLFGPTAVGTPGANKTPYVFIADRAEHIRIDHNDFRNKANPGNVIVVDGDRTVSPEQVCQHIRIDHNVIRSIKPEVANEKEPVRFGWSGQSKSDSHSVIERNWFFDCICEPEVISVKASSFRVSGNVILRSIGGAVLRHGTDGQMTDNYIVDRAQTFGSTIGSGGFRFYDARHDVSYNYVDGVYGGNFQGPLLLDTGDAEGSSTNLAGHWRVVDAKVERNVIVGGPEGVRIGDNYSSAPIGCTIIDNVVIGAASGEAVTQRIAPISSALVGNVFYASVGAAGATTDSLTIVRKPGYGPRLTYLQQGDVGITGDLNDADGTGVLVSGGGTTPPPSDGTAATANNWGIPLPQSDEFDYTGNPDPSKWSVEIDAVKHRTPERVTVSGGKAIFTGVANGDAAGVVHGFSQQYGRYEVRARSLQNGVAPSQTLGVGGVATPPGAIVATGNQGALTISSGGTADNPKVYDGKGFTCGRVTINSSAQYVVIQNYNIRPGNNYGCYINGSHITVQNCDFNDVRGPGDINIFTLLKGSYIDILYNTAVNAVSNPGGSHTDAIQTWVSSSNTPAVNNVRVIGNKFVGPHNPNRDNSIPSIHQIIMVESEGRGGNSGGSGTPTNWYVADNEFAASWGQDIKTDYGNQFVFTRNRFTGSSSRVFGPLGGSGNIVYSDNTFGSGYGSIGYPITSGSGPASPISGGGSSGENYSPIVWVEPDSRRFPQDGEYQFVSNIVPGESVARSYLYFPQDAGLPALQYRAFSKSDVDTSVFHNYGFEWTSDGITAYVDGVQWFVTSGGATTQWRNIQAMPAGHLRMALANFYANSMVPATMEVEWVRVYSLTPSGPGAGAQTVSPTAISSANAFGIAGITGGNLGGTHPTLLGTGDTILGSMTLGNTANGPAPSGKVVTGAGGIASGQVFGVPELFEEFGPKNITTISFTGEGGFGTPRVRGGNAPNPAPGGVLVPVLFAVATDGTTLTPLPAWTKISVSPVRNSPGSLSIDYPAGAPGFSLLHDQVSASPLRALEIRLWLGGSQEGALGGWLVQKAGDDLEPGSSWTFSGHFHEWILSKALIFPQAISDANKNGTLKFTGANAGLILSTIMNQAQARGALPLVTRDFTNTVDSNGQPWAQSASALAFAPKTTCLQVAEKLVELGMCEFELTAARVWRAFNPGTRGVDRTTGATPLTFAHAVNLSEHSRRESSKDAGTAVLMAGAEGFYATVSSATAQSELGWRAEVAGDAGQIASQAGVQAVAATYLETVRAGIAEYASSVEFAAGSPLPLLDYGIDDWAYTWAGDKRRRLRIAQIVLEFSADGPPSGKVALNDLITDKISALYRRLNAISSGDTVVGTSTPTTGGSGEDVIPPAAPEGVTVSSTIAYQVPGEFVTRALVDVGWQEVTTNAFVDSETAEKAQAATLIAARIRANQPMFEDWTWPNAPAVVGLYNDPLLEEWKNAPENPGEDGGDAGQLRAAAASWLEDYAEARSGGGAITDDVDHYRVMYRYLGAQVIGQPVQAASADDVVEPAEFEPTPPRDPREITDDTGWAEPTESPTSSTRLTFGDVIGGRSISVRVSAVDRAGNQGPWSVPVAATTAVDDQPPPVPSKPIATAWFETMNVTWDGKGSSGEDMFAAAADFGSGGMVEVHVALGIDFTPDRPLGPDGRTVDISQSTTYKTFFMAAGTTNIADLEIGTTYFVRFVAVDRNGNASQPSETSAGVLPQQLVNIDIGPDAISRIQIIDGEIVTAKIADLAVNDAKIADLSVGKLTAGTMTAQVTISGRFQTPVTNGHQIQFDNAGIRLYRQGTVIGRWEVFDGSMLVTGQFQSAITAQRIVMNPGGSNADTIRFYPSGSEAYSSIDAVDYNGGTIAGIRIVGSGTTAIANRGMVLVRDQYASLVHGRTDFSYFGSEMWVEPNFTRNKSAAVDLIIDERLTSLNGPRRVAMICYNTAGQPINATGLYYKKTGAFGGEPMLYANGQDVGIVFGGTDGITSSRILVRSNANTQFREITAGAFTLSSSREVKHGIRELDTDPVQHLRGRSPKHFRRHGDLDGDAERLGFIAEEMPDEVRNTVQIQMTDGGTKVLETIDPFAVTALLWAATQRIDERLAALEADRIPPKRK